MSADADSPVPPEPESLLAANQAFYRAFGAGDLAAMDALWAREAAVACIHPGWVAIIGRDKVMESWRAILANAGSPRPRPSAAHALAQDGWGMVICFEHLGSGVLIATNVFAREAGAWKLVHHQSGPTASEAAPPPERPTVLH